MKMMKLKMCTRNSMMATTISMISSVVKFNSSVTFQTIMFVLLIVRPKCTLAATHGATR